MVFDVLQDAIFLEPRTFVAGSLADILFADVLLFILRSVTMLEERPALAVADNFHRHVPFAQVAAIVTRIVISIMPTRSAGTLLNVMEAT